MYIILGTDALEELGEQLDFRDTTIRLQSGDVIEMDRLTAGRAVSARVWVRKLYYLLGQKTWLLPFSRGIGL